MEFICKSIATSIKTAMYRVALVIMKTWVTLLSASTEQRFWNGKYYGRATNTNIIVTIMLSLKRDSSQEFEMTEGRIIFFMIFCWKTASAINRIFVLPHFWLEALLFLIGLSPAAYSGRFRKRILKDVKNYWMQEEDFFTSCLAQCVNLKIKILILSWNPGITDKHFFAPFDSQNSCNIRYLKK